MKKGIVIGTALAAAVLIYAGLTATIVPQGQEATLTGEVEFDPTKVATDFWEQKSAAYFEKNAVDLVTLIKKSEGQNRNFFFFRRRQLLFLGVFFFFVIIYLKREEKVSFRRG